MAFYFCFVVTGKQRWIGRERSRCTVEDGELALLWQDWLQEVHSMQLLEKRKHVLDCGPETVLEGPSCQVK